MEKRRVVITGLGTVNPLGNNTADSWAAAKAGKCGIGPITQFDTTDFKCKLAGEVKGFDPETIVDKKEARKMARFTLLALAAAAEAIADSVGFASRNTFGANFKKFTGLSLREYRKAARDVRASDDSDA